jgi:hypothetical protein
MAVQRPYLRSAWRSLTLVAFASSPSPPTTTGETMSELDGEPADLLANQMLNTQQAPFPKDLADIVATLEYRPGWRFELESFERDPGSEGLTFKILSKSIDTYNPGAGEIMRVWHYFPVPPATFNRESWLEWVRDRLLEIEEHETCEFMVVDGKRPFVPNHGPGWNPYQVRTLNTLEAAETTFRGERIEGSQA